MQQSESFPVQNLRKLIGDKLFTLKMILKSILPLACIFLCLHSTLCTRMLEETSPDSRVLNTQIYVQQSTLDYFYYKVYSSQGSISVQVLDSSLQTYSLSFTKDQASLFYRTAYNRYIIVEQKNSANKTVSYWVLQIVSIQTGFELQSFSVDSRKDDQGFELNDDYTLTSVIEYDRVEKLLYVTLQSVGDLDVYAINAKTRATTLKTINWFFYSKQERQTIVGGNSRVLVDATKSQFMFDTQNVRNNNSDPTIYDKVNISDYTTLPVYKESSLVYNFIGSYFQYVSISSDGLNMTTFLWQGYQKTTTVLKQSSLNSSSQKIKFFSDQQTFFFAIADNEVYATKVKWVEEIQQYEVWGYTLTEYVQNESQRKVWLENFNSALLITYFNKKFYVLTTKYFLMYGETSLYSKKLDECVKQGDDLQKIIMTEMKNYLEMNP